MLSLMKVITASVMKVIRTLTEGPYYMQKSFLSHLTIGPHCNKKSYFMKVIIASVMKVIIAYKGHI